MSLDTLIANAQAEVTAAEALPDSDTTKAQKLATTKGKLSALQEAKGAGYTRTPNDVSSAVQNRLPDAESSAKKAEREAIAAALGIPADQLTDQRLAELKKLREGQQSDLENERGEKEAAQSRVKSLEESEAKAKKASETAKAQLEDTLKAQAVERALLAAGVIHETGEGKHSYLTLTTEQAMRLGEVTVEVEVADDGSLTVKGEVKGADEAAKKAKETFPAMFGQSTTSVQNPPQTPPSGGGGSSDAAGGYRGNYSGMGRKAS